MQNWGGPAHFNQLFNFQIAMSDQDLSRFASMSVSELKSFLRANGISFATCVEKSDFRDLALETARNLPSSSSSSSASTSRHDSHSEAKFSGNSASPSENSPSSKLNSELPPAVPFFDSLRLMNGALNALSHYPILPRTDMSRGSLFGHSDFAALRDSTEFGDWMALYKSTLDQGRLFGFAEWLIELVSSEECQSGRESYTFLDHHHVELFRQKFFEPDLPRTALYLYMLMDQIVRCFNVCHTADDFGFDASAPHIASIRELCETADGCSRMMDLLTKMMSVCAWPLVRR